MVYSSPITPGTLIIDDSNWHLHAGPRSPTEDGRGRIPRDWQATPYGFCAYAKRFDLPLIPRNEWTDRIEEIDRTQSGLLHLWRLSNQKTLDQNGTNYCWCNGVITSMMCLQSINRPPPYEPLSPASVAAPIKGYRNQGGWGGEALEYIVKYGVYPQRLWPANAISKQYKTNEGDTEAANYKVSEWYELENRDFDQLMTLLLLRIPVAVGYNWWGHEVCAIQPVAMGSGRYGAGILNSWSDSYGDRGYAVLAESKATPDDAVAPVVRGYSSGTRLVDLVHQGTSA